MCGPHDRLPWAVVVASLVISSSAWAQEGEGTRPLAPGVLTVITADVKDGETSTGPVPVVEIVRGIPNLEWTPNYDPKSQTLLGMASGVVYRRPVWALEFAFKPLRMIEVDVPQPSGKMQRKLIWYLVYRARNNGYDLVPKGSEDRWGHETFAAEEYNIFQLRFFPHFVLKSLEFDKEYLDRILPSAQRAIQEREDPGVKLHNSVEMGMLKIPLSDERLDRGLWGVAMWSDVDPRIDFFSVFAEGLTNAFDFEDPPGGFTPGSEPGTGRIYRSKALQLNFWRPGDTVMEHEREIRFGVPVDPNPTEQLEILKRYGLKERLDYLWVYR